MPKKGPDAEKLQNITNILKRVGSNGIWIRELARQTNLPIATIHYYLNEFMKNQVKIETAKIGRFDHSQIKIIKLKVMK